MAFSFWLEPFKVNVTWGKKKRKDVITRCQSNNTFLIALLINICWCLELTNTMIHPYWASPVKLNNCLAFGSVDDPARVLVPFCRGRLSDAGLESIYTETIASPYLFPSPFPMPGETSLLSSPQDSS